MTKHPIRIIGCLDPSGYGAATRGIVQAMAAVGYGPEIVRFVPAITTSTAIGRHDELEDGWLEPYFTGDRSVEDKINIVHLNPALAGIYHTAVGGRYNIAYCAWETDRLPKKEHLYHGEHRTVVECLNLFDEVWVPSTFLVDVFKNSGVTAPIFVIPHALQESLLKLPPGKPAALKGDVRTTFYTIGSWNPRKNTAAVARAYWSCGWNPLTKTQLVLHQIPANRTEEAIFAHQDTARQELIALKEGHPDGKDAQLNIHCTPKPYSWVLRLHQSGHVLVSGSRGEGFGCGIPALEALALGSYVVGGGGPALEDLAAVVPGSVTVLPYQQAPVEPMAEGFELDQMWWDVRQQDLSEEMKLLHSFVQEEGMPDPQDVEKVRDTYSPSTIGKLIQKRLEHAYDVLESRD